MSLDEAIEQAKVQEQEKEAISLKVPAFIKQKLQSIADTNNISMNNLISSILSDVLYGSVSNNAYELYQEFKEISKKLDEITVSRKLGVPYRGFSIDDSMLDNEEDYINNIIDKYNLLKSILGVTK
ncbi:MAG: hypothetical protein PHH41_07755 [Sulfurimonas sp.]|nr:hypothetical protein [Sulfurimonas sp.]MDD3060546.1 hypothetical protein [Sulfurimonas sp.]MDD5203017.1 hypothetical protein [Sulfurimonas sp.]